MSAKILIDLAAEKAGSLRKLGELLEIPAGNLTQMKQGKRPCKAHMRARIAEVAGVDPTRAILEGLKDELDESDEIQKGAQTMLQAMLDAFPNRSLFIERANNVSTKYRKLWLRLTRRLWVEVTADSRHRQIVPRH
jgi:hypothetical protein